MVRKITGKQEKIHKILCSALSYEEKMDRIAGQLEELMLDALLAALRKLRERNELFQRIEQSPPKSSPDFWHRAADWQWRFIESEKIQAGSK